MWVPERGWLPATSFPEPLAPPSVDPDAAPTVQVCVNRQWVPYIVGALAQLVQPVIWDVPDVAALQTTIERATDLMALFQSPDSCMQLRFNGTTCNLEQSVDGGVTWTPVDGWAANFDACVKAHIPPQVPPNPAGDLGNQHACNIAGFLATDLIQLTMTAMDTAIATSQSEKDFAVGIIKSLAFAFPITAAAGTAFGAFYDYVSAQIASQVHTAATDPALWSAVTCAIYTAIRPVGYVDGTNFGSVQTALNALSYNLSWVHTALANYWGNLGLQNIQAAQAVGALAVVDCTGCGGPWCHEFDFRLATNGFTVSGGTNATWVSGTGWLGGYEPGPDVMRLWIAGSPWPVHGVVNRISLFYSDPFPGSAINENHIPHVTLFSSGVDVFTFNLPNPFGGLGRLDIAVPNISADSVSIYLISEHNVTAQAVVYAIVAGTGTPPFPTLDCAD